MLLDGSLMLRDVISVNIGFAGGVICVCSIEFAIECLYFLDEFDIFGL